MKRLFAIAVVLVWTVLPAAAQTAHPADADVGKGKVVGLDYFYNHQVRNGKQFHYVWEDTAVSGFSKFGQVFEQYGATLGKLATAPTLHDLKRFSIYIIVNPNNEVKAADHKPNYILEPDIAAMETWVNDGGVLALFANDEPNGGCEFTHFNDLTKRFGITFNNVLRNKVPNSHDRTPGTFDGKYFPDHPIFAGIKMIYMKEVCTITAASPATALFSVPKENNQPGTDTIMAVSHYGKGTVFAIVDPWVYNEYIDVKAPGLPIDNRRGAENLAKWLLSISAPPLGS